MSGTITNVKRDSGGDCWASYGTQARPRMESTSCATATRQRPRNAISWSSSKPVWLGSFSWLPWEHDLTISGYPKHALVGMEFIRHGLRAKKEKWKSSTETAGTRWDAAVSWETAAIWSLAKRRHDHFSRPPKGSTYIDRWIFWSQHDVYDITIYDWYWLVVRPNIYHHLSTFQVCELLQ